MDLSFKVKDHHTTRGEGSPADLIGHCDRDALETETQRRVSTEFEHAHTELGISDHDPVLARCQCHIPYVVLHMLERLALELDPSLGPHQTVPK
jgi:hypothetical protein